MALCVFPAQVMYTDMGFSTIYLVPYISRLMLIIICLSGHSQRFFSIFLPKFCIILTFVFFTVTKNKQFTLSVFAKQMEAGAWHPSLLFQNQNSLWAQRKLLSSQQSFQVKKKSDNVNKWNKTKRKQSPLGKSALGALEKTFVEICQHLAARHLGHHYLA